MCGVIGIVSNHEDVVKGIFEGLQKISYRGYDSAGICIEDKNGRMQLRKDIGTLEGIKKKWGMEDIKGLIGIGHNRWATHGGVTQANAHPHADCSTELFIVHNGIINNYLELRNSLIAKGHVFRSETDSEVIAHFFEEELRSRDMKETVREFFGAISGEFAILLTRKGDQTIYALKRGSPLVLGICEGKNILASDIYAFSNQTNKAIFFNEDEFAVVSADGYEFYRYADGNLVPQKKEIVAFELHEDDSNMKDYEHYMAKEIMEEPAAASRLMKSLEIEQGEKLAHLKQMITSSRRVIFVASGTSYHASLLGVYFLNKAGIEAHTIIASEFKNFTLLDEGTLVIAISQSGETMDVIEALHGIKARGVKIASLVNVPYSTVQRMSNVFINICAGQEVCVAATKTFVNQVLALLHIASLFGYGAELNKIPELIEEFLKQREKIKSIAKDLKDAKDIYIIGRGFSYPVAREIALKLKEISYIHAEGMMGGELKHGTLALIERGTPVIALMPKSDTDIISNVKEVEARGGRIIAFAEDGEFENTITIPAVDKGSFSLLATIAGQLLTYYIAKEKGLPIDKPRNLAKAVTTR